MVMSLTVHIHALGALMRRSRASADKVVIDVWLAEHPFPDYLAPAKEMARAFEKAHPNYHVKLQGYDFRELPEKVANAVEQGNPPDIAEYYYTATQLARDTRGDNGKPLFTSVEKAIGGRKEILGEPVVLDDIISAARDYYTYDGDLTSVPVTATTTLLYVNRTLLDAAGVPGIPRTWDQIEAACEAVARLAHGPSHGITWPNHGWLLQQAVAEQGGLLADNDNGRSTAATTVDLASKEMLAYVQWWRRLYEEGHYLYTGTQWDWGGPLEAFTAQQVAFTISTSKLTDALTRMSQDAGFELEVGRMPRNGHVPYAGDMVSGQSLWLADGLGKSEQDGALAFIQYVLNPRNAADWHKASGFLPITGGSFDLLAEEGWFDKNPHLRVATDQLHAADGSPAALGAMLGDFAEIQRVMTQAMEDVLVREADPVVRFTQATADAQNLLDEYGAHCHGAIPRTPQRLDVG